MAVIAVVTAGDVSRVLAGRRDTVMAGAAGTHHLCVIHGSHWRKHIGVVAVFADIRRLHVCQILASGFDAVVAANAVTRDVHVVKGRRSPAERGVTVVARVVAGDMSWVFAGRDDAIVTGTAGTNYLRVVDGKHRHKHIGVVAVFADNA
jgi:hypothetical protein